MKTLLRSLPAAAAVVIAVLIARPGVHPRADTQRPGDGKYRCTWSPGIKPPAPTAPTLPDDPRLDKSISLSIPGWPLDRTLSAIGQKTGVKLTPSSEVQALKVIIEVRDVPVRTLLLNVARLFHLYWRWRPSSQGGTAYILTRNQRMRGFIRAVEEAELSYFQHRLECWRQAGIIPPEERPAFFDAHPEVWGDGFGWGGLGDDGPRKAPELMALLTPEQLLHIAAGGRVSVRWSDLPPERRAAVERWLVPSISATRLGLISPLKPSDEVDVDPAVIPRGPDALKYAVLIATADSKPGFASCESQILLSIRNLNLPTPVGRSQLVSVGAKLNRNQSPVRAAVQLLTQRPEGEGLPLPPELRSILADKRFPLPHAPAGASGTAAPGRAGPAPDALQTFDLPFLVAALSRAGNLNIISDYHYWRGRMYRDELMPSSATECAARVLDHFRLEARKSDGMWLLRDAEWWLSDRMDLPETEVAMLQTVLSRQGRLSVREAARLAASTTQEQFEALVRWRLPQLAPLTHRHSALASVGVLSDAEFASTEGQDGLPLDRAPEPIKAWVEDALDSRPEYRPAEREAWLQHFLAEGRLRIREEPRNAADKPIVVRLVAQTPGGRRVQETVLLPTRPGGASMPKAR